MKRTFLQQLFFNAIAAGERALTRHSRTALHLKCTPATQPDICTDGYTMDDNARCRGSSSLAALLAQPVLTDVLDG